MSRDDLLAELLKLPPEERLQLADDLLDSVGSDSSGPFSLTNEQLAEVERRLAEHDRDPSTALSWTDVRAELLAALK